jgi:hypothetical protein
MYALIMTIGLATITCLAGEFLPKAKALQIYAMLLTGVASVYVGFAVMEGRRDRITLELLAALGFATLALWSLWKWPLLLVAGFALHAAWNLVHHPGNMGARVKPWYAFAAFVYDSSIGLYIYLRLLH